MNTKSAHPPEVHEDFADWSDSAPQPFPDSGPGEFSADLEEAMYREGERVVAETMRREAERLWSQRLGHRINEARTAVSLSRAELATKMAVHPNTVAKWERGESRPDAIELLTLSNLLRVGVLRLLGVGDQEGGLTVPNDDLAVERDSHVFVPLYDIQAAAGYGSFNDRERVKEMKPFAADYIRHDLQIRHNELALISVRGNSMEPQIQSGDVVMIDRRDTSVQVEGAHLVRIDGALLVKILERRPGQKVRVSSINPRHEPFEIELEGGSDFEVLGRVRWAGVTFR